MSPENMIAIDPGAQGGIVMGPFYPTIIAPLGTSYHTVQRGPAEVRAIAMPKTDGDISFELAPHGYWNDAEKVAYLEDLVKFAGRNMPSSRMAVYAANWGFIKGCLTYAGYRIIIVPPKKWQQALGLGSAKELTKTQWKNKLKERAQQLYPKLNVTLSTADALLIYEAARRGLLG
jgi:hypothetical protein